MTREVKNTAQLLLAVFMYESRSQSHNDRDTGRMHKATVVMS